MAAQVNAQRQPVEAPAGRPGHRRVAMALYGDLTFDSRVQREARSLVAAGYEVVIYCLAWRGDPTALKGPRVVVIEPPGAAVIPGSSNPFFARGAKLAALWSRISWLRRYVQGLRAWGHRVVAASDRVDVWHAHDLTGFAAIAASLPRGAPVVYDSHELYLGTGTALRLPALAQRALRAYERRLVARASLVVTVNQELARVLARRYRPRAMCVVHNCPDQWVVPFPRPTLLRDAIAVPSSTPILLYHGALSANRGIEQSMDALLEPGLEDAHLVLLGFGELRDPLREAAADPRWAGRIHILDAVPPSELVSWVASADVGLMAIQPATPNDRLSTPNKLFECLAAGTPVVTTDLPIRRLIVMDDPNGPLGAVCDAVRPGSIALAIRSIIESDPHEMESLRARCRQAAEERWNWDHEAGVLLDAYAGIVGPHG